VHKSTEKHLRMMLGIEDSVDKKGTAVPTPEFAKAFIDSMQAKMKSFAYKGTSVPMVACVAALSEVLEPILKRLDELEAAQGGGTNGESTLELTKRIDSALAIAKNATKTADDTADALAEAIANSKAEKDAQKKTTKSTPK